MPVVDIDEETYNYLQSKAIAYVEKPGDTIKRLLGIGQNANMAMSPAVSYQKTSKRRGQANEVNVIDSENSDYSYSFYPIQSVGRVDRAKKKRKTNLPELMEAGILKENQRLIFQNYRGVKYPDYKVYIVKGLLKYEGKSFTMSALAGKILKEVNNEYDNDAVRGPIFWVTEEGETIAELWDNYLTPKRVK